MTIKEYLNSRKFKKDYKIWYYHFDIVDESGNSIQFKEELNLIDPECREEFLNTHDVLKVETAWELDDAYESYAYAKITTRL